MAPRAHALARAAARGERVRGNACRCRSRPEPSRAPRRRLALAPRRKHPTRSHESYQRQRACGGHGWRAVRPARASAQISESVEKGCEQKARAPKLGDVRASSVRSSTRDGRVAPARHVLRKLVAAPRPTCRRPLRARGRRARPLVGTLRSSGRSPQAQHACVGGLKGRNSWSQPHAADYPSPLFHHAISSENQEFKGCATRAK